MSTKQITAAAGTQNWSSGEFLGGRILALLLLVLGVITGLAQGGAMMNGFTYDEDLPAGATDTWTFTANAGDGIAVGMGKIVANSTLYPLLRLYGPNGVLVESNFGQAGAGVSTQATNSGTFTVVASNYETVSFGGNGAYRITLAITTVGNPAVVAAGDEGGAMTNGFTYEGELPIGDLDVWTFAANAGDGIAVGTGEIVANSTLYPLLRLYGPNGVLVDWNFGQAGAGVSTQATNSGTFTVVASNYETVSFGGNGAYRITLAITTVGNPAVVAAGDEGGAMTNGFTYEGELPIGDLDVWTFAANAGDGIAVGMGKIVANSTLYPLLRLYGPNGVLVESNFGQAGAGVSTQATNSGTFTVVASNYEIVSFGGNGAYRITLAITTVGNPVVVAAGDEGGAMNGAAVYHGTIDVGDLDVWKFTACAGNSIALQMNEVISGSTLYPFLRLYGPNGAVVGSNFGQAGAGVSTHATNSGTFTVVVGNNESASFGGSGTYQLTVNGLSNDLQLCDPKPSGTNVILSGIGGSAGAEFIVFTSPLVEAPLATWTPLFTNQFNSYGAFTHMDAFIRAEPNRFFMLQQH